MEKREIKFRTWVNGHMVYNCGFHPYAALNLVHAANMDESEFKTKDEQFIYAPGFCEFMQYTGVNDETGFVEIYEGDIVKCDYGLAQVKYSDSLASFIVQWIDDTEANIELLALSRRNLTRREEYEVFEVIGNIYQNPELL